MNLSQRIVFRRLLPLSFNAGKRWRSRNLPKIYGDDETPYMSCKNTRKFKDSVQIFSVLHQTWTWQKIKEVFKQKKAEAVRESQKFLPERHQILGPNLAATHFITFRGGKVKFTNADKWFTFEDVTSGLIPSEYDSKFLVQAIDASGTELCYEGFANFAQLFDMRALILKNCESVDDWCLHRLYILEKSLEYLDISGCKNISERGICSLHSLKKLKKLVMNDTPNIANKELAVLLLQDVLPECEVVGVQLNNPEVLNRVEASATQSGVKYNLELH